MNRRRPIGLVGLMALALVAAAAPGSVSEIAPKALPVRGERPKPRAMPWSSHARVNTTSPILWYATDAGEVIGIADGLTKDSVEKVKGARLMRRAERRRLVGIDAWRTGQRAPTSLT